MAAAASPGSSLTAVKTSLALINQFLSSLESVGNTTADDPQTSSHPSPSHLLTVSATSLKSSTTKLSLLTITAPFTASAITSVIQPLNSSILPSLVTAALLTTTRLYPESYVKECHALVRAVLRDLKGLLLLVKARSEDGRPKSDIAENDKKNVTEVTGKVWEDCDFLIRFAKEDVADFVVRKANQWLELMKDAVKELEEWDPEEDDIDDQDWLGLDDAGSDDDDEATAAASGEKNKAANTDRATISAGVKDQALKVLSRIPQSVHVVVKQRLEKMPRQQPTNQTEAVEAMPDTQRQTIDLVLRKARSISDCIDESAEGMYMGDPELCLKKAGEARALTIEVVEAVLEPWTTGEETEPKVESKQDQYIKRALVWIQQVTPERSTVSTKETTKSGDTG